MPVPDVTATAVGSMYTTAEVSMFPKLTPVVFCGVSAVSVLLLGFAARKPSAVRILLAAPSVFASVALVYSETMRAARGQNPQSPLQSQKPKPASWVEV